MVSPNMFLWPTMIVEEWARLVGLAGHGPDCDPQQRAEKDEPSFASPNEIALELGMLTLRRFSAPVAEIPTLVCAPYALHGATVADFADSHSLMQILLEEDVSGLHLVQWRSATPDMRFMTIDTLLADLNVAVDSLGGRVNLVGLCQGGWLSVLYAARFPAKVARLVVAGAPLNVAAAASDLSSNAASIPLSGFEQLVEEGGGLVLGTEMLRRWTSAGSSTGVEDIMMLPRTTDPGAAEALHRRFATWFMSTMNLPGAYYLQVVQWLYKENRLARDAMPALGMLSNLGAISAPVCLLAATEDELVPPAQMFSVADAFTGAPSPVMTLSTPGPHLGLFMGRRTLDGPWRKIAGWLKHADAKGVSPRRGHASPKRAQRSRT